MRPCHAAALEARLGKGGCLLNSAEREDAGDDQAVAMGFKEVEPVDFLVGTCLVGFPSGAAPSPRLHHSRADPFAQWDITTALAQN